MYRQDEPEVNLEQILEKIRSFNPFRRGGDDDGGGGGGRGGNGIAYFVLGLFAVGIVFWMGTGIYTVQPGEEAVLRLVGRYEITTGPGLHWYWPTPIGKRDVVNVDEVRRLEIGVRGSAPIPDEAQMITGDQNIVDAQLLVQYNIKSSQDFLFKAVDPAGLTIKDAAETSLRQVVGQRAIDDVLTVEKEAVQEDTRLKLQELLDLYQTGIRVTEVKLLNVRPPEQVQDAFDDVVRAREDKDRIINLADAYKESQLPLARGEAARLTEAAEAFRETRVAQATGQADRFLAVLQEYRKAPGVTRQRLYLEAMEEILPGVTKFIVDADNGGNLLQLLPLNETTNGTTPFSVPTPTSN